MKKEIEQFLTGLEIKVMRNYILKPGEGMLLLNPDDYKALKKSK